MTEFLESLDFLAVYHYLTDYLSKQYDYTVNFINEIANPPLVHDNSSRKSDKYGIYDPFLELAIVYVSIVPDLQTLVLACFHEYRHGFQHQKRLIPNEEYFFWTNLAGKEDATGVYYTANPLEVDARAFAATLGKTTLLPEILCKISMEEAEDLIEQNNTVLLKQKLFDTTYKYHQIVESLPPLSEIYSLIDAVIPQNLRMEAQGENAP